MGIVFLSLRITEVHVFMNFISYLILCGTKTITAQTKTFTVLVMLHVRDVEQGKNTKGKRSNKTARQ